MANLQLLKIELADDPLSRGYSAMNDQQVADSLNVKDRTVNRGLLESHEVFEAIVRSEAATLPAADQRLLSGMLGMGTIDASGPQTQATFLGMFGAGTTTRANLIALATELISRAVEVAIGLVHSGDVTAARAI